MIHESTRNNTKSLFLSVRMFSWIVSLFFIISLSSVLELHGQRRRPRPRAPARPAIDYSKFSHSTEKHQAKCNTCHKVPTSNWQIARDYPDVADYPDHDACVSCHRPQFFRGDRPVICTICHTQSSPRSEARLAFGNPGAPHQFLIEFPHDKHQDVIARLFKFSRPSERSLLFRRAAFQAQQEKVDPYNNCTLCHKPVTTLPSVGASSWVDGYLPDALTFKNAPTTHASCFNCHWKAEEPVAGNCNGCHKLTTTNVSLREFPTRISLKFKHDGGGQRKNHVGECTTCHINITKSVTLRGLKPDVPITACTECHNKDGLRLDVAGELAQIDKNRDFVCVYCHTSDVGRRDPPASHYLISERPPITRKDVK